jgi:integrase
MLATVRKPIAASTLADLQDGIETLQSQAPASRVRRIGAVKSPLSFAERTGLLPFNVGAALRVPAVEDVLAERILKEAEGIKLIALEPDKRNHAILRLGYIAGLRISELAGLRWRDTKRQIDLSVGLYFVLCGAGAFVLCGRTGTIQRCALLPSDVKWSKGAPIGI